MVNLEMRFVRRHVSLFLLLFLSSVSLLGSGQDVHLYGPYDSSNQVNLNLRDDVKIDSYFDAPSLGTYPSTTIVLGQNTTVIPSTLPTGTTSITVSTHVNFAGRLTANPVTGVVRVTNAYPANILPETYTVTVKAFGPGGVAVQTFTLTVVTSTPCPGSTGFISVSEITIERPVGVAIGDFNNDGIQDFASATVQTSNTVRIRLGNGDGSFSTAPDIPFATQLSLIGVGDFNGDGNQDLAVPTSGTVSIELGNGSGAFTHFTTVTLANDNATSVAIGDFNGDGIQDFATNNGTFTNINIRLGIGNGGFSGAPNVAVPYFPGSIALGDFNGDGLQDIIATTTLHTVEILLGNGSGGFTAPPVSTVDISNAPSRLRVGDFNNDGKQDFAVSIPNSNTVAIRLGDGNGGFISPAVPEMTVGNVPQGLEIGDFNRDGNQDFAVASSNSGSSLNSFSIRYGDGGGGFTLPVRPAVPLGGSSFGSTAIGDFNGDGIQDLAATDTNSSRVSIRLGSCMPFSVNGTVRYGNAIGFPTPRPVSNVTISGEGAINVLTTTIAPGPGAGNYSLSGFGAGSYVVTPSKTGGANNITSFDAALIAQYVAGTSALTTNQLIVSDVSGNGTVSSFDAGQIARYTTSIPGTGATGTWKFIPTTRSYGAIDNYFDNQDFIALLMGEVSGNWLNTGARPVSEIKAH